MRDLFGGLGMVIGGALLLMIIFAGLDYSGILWESFTGPKREDVRREIFEQTKSFNQGMTMKLLDYRKQYILAKDPADKAAIAQVVSHMFADMNTEKLDSELKAFLRECKYNQQEK
jgi:hypothetical protein